MRDGAPLFGEAASRKRNAMALSQEAIAERAGISRTFVSSIETGKASPTIAVAAAVAHALGTTVGQLLGETEPPVPAEDPRVPRLADALRGIRDAAIEAMGALTPPSPMPQLPPRPPRATARMEAPDLTRGLRSPLPSRQQEMAEDVLQAALVDAVRERAPLVISRFDTSPNRKPIEFERKGPHQNVDGFRPFYGEPLEVQALLAAGEGREVFEPTGETTPDLPNPVVREHRKPGKHVARVAGDSMEPFYPEGSWVAIEERDSSGFVSGQVVAAHYNGEPLIKVLRFDRTNGDRRNVRLESLNRRYKPIRVKASDSLKLLGVIVATTIGERRF